MQRCPYCRRRTINYCYDDDDDDAVNGTVTVTTATVQLLSYYRDNRLSFVFLHYVCSMYQRFTYLLTYS